MTIPDLLAAARGDRLADLVFRNARVVNVFSGEIEQTDVAITGDVIVGLGPDYRAEREIDLGGAYLLPGFIDAHVHIESSLVTPFEFARAVVPRGTTTVICDPHEIANVHGLEGIRYMLDASEGLPLSVLVMASSCVPATPMGTAGAALDASALLEIAGHPRVLGLAEVMNFPGVIGGDPDMLEKIAAFRGRSIDGHAPRVRGQPLNAYVLAGPSSDHESTTADEAREKIARGLFLFVREATNARNMRDLLPALTPATLRRAAFCTDDRTPADLLDQGGIDMMVRFAIESGIDPIEAIRMATLNPAEHYGLRDRGAIAPGRRADLVVVDDLKALAVRQVWSSGVLAADGGRGLGWAKPAGQRPAPSMRVDIERVSFRIDAGVGGTNDARESSARGTPSNTSGSQAGALARVIRVIPDQIVTGRDEEAPLVLDGEVVADPSRDLLKIAVLERHTGSGRMGLGLVRGMGLRAGAMAGTVAHDHHNLIVIGADDASMHAAARAVMEMGGGLAVASHAKNGGDWSHAGSEEAARGDTSAPAQVVARVPLPVGGLMSDDPVEEVRVALDRATAAVHALGSPLHDPFMAMSFLGLEVIPSLKITDFGVVDVEQFQIVGLWV